MSETYLDLGKRQEIHRDGTVTPEFGRLYRRAHQRLISVYQPGSSAWEYGKPSRADHSRSMLEIPTDDPQEFVAERFMKSHEWEQEFTTQLAMIIANLEQSRWQSNGFELREDQQADLACVLFSMCTGNRNEAGAILLRGCTGKGKTPVLAECTHAFIRSQEYWASQGQPTGIGVFATANTTHLGGKLHGGEARVFRSPPYTLPEKTVGRYRRELSELYNQRGRDVIGEFFPMADWKDMFMGKHDDPRGAAIVSRVLFSRGKLDKWRSTVEKADEIERTIAALIDGTKVLVSGIYRTPDFLNPAPIPDGIDDEALARFSGDATFRIPQGYPVQVSRKEFQIGEFEGQPRFMCVPATGVYGVAAQTRHPETIREIRYIAGDEAKGTSPDQWTEPTIQAGGKRRPMLVLLTATDKHRATGLEPGKNGRNFTRTAEMGVREAIERGILANVGFGFVNGADGERFSPGTEEAWGQFSEHYFREGKLLKASGQKQRWQRNGLILVPGSNTREVGHRMQRELAQRGLPGKVVCYDSKLSGANGDKELVEIWYANRDDDAEHLPHILIANPATAFAVSLRSIEYAAALTPLSEDDLMQFFGRVTHADGHRRGTKKERDNFRVLFDQQLHWGKDPKLNMLRLLDADGTFPEKDWSWVDGQCVLSTKARKADARIAKGADFKTEKQRVPDLLQFSPIAERTKKGIPLRNTAPSLSNLLEVQIYNLPATEITQDMLLKWAMSYDAQVCQTYGILPVRIREILEAASKEKGSGDVVLERLKKWMDSMIARRGASQ